MKLIIEKIGFSYYCVEVLKDVSFELRPGEILGIVGPNGSGKSTLLKCINRVLKPGTGAVFIGDTDLAFEKQKEIAKRIGVVPQNSDSRFSFTVFDTVLMGRFPHLGRFTKEKEEDYRITERCLRISGIERLASRLITEISGGEHQKVIIARALAQEPNVLLLDEPTLHLDISHQIELLELLRNLSKDENLIVAMVSHDLNLAARYSDRIVILKDGEIYQAGLPNETLNRQSIKEVYGIETEIVRSRITDSLNIIPVSTVK